MKKIIEEAKLEKGNVLAICIAEAVVYFCSTFGFSDYLLNTIIYKKTGWVEDERIPGSLVTSYIFPGIFIAATYVSGGIDFDPLTFLICIPVEMIGSIIGSKLVLSFDVKKIKKVIGYAMLFSMVALVFKMIVSSGASGTANGIHGLQYLIAVPIVFAMGVLNMMGVPMKPPLMSMFLLMGMTPLATIMLLMCMSVPGPIAGSINIFKSGKYGKKVFLCAATVGSLSAIVGGFFALNANTIILTVLMLIAMGIVAYSMLKK